MVLRHLAQILALIPMMVLFCKFMFCRFKVLTLECDRLAPLVELLPQTSHFLLITFMFIFLIYLIVA